MEWLNSEAARRLMPTGLTPEQAAYSLPRARHGLERADSESVRAMYARVVEACEEVLRMRRTEATSELIGHRSEPERL